MAKVTVYPTYVGMEEAVTSVAGTTVTDATTGCDVVLNGIDTNGHAVSVKDESALFILENTSTSALDVTVKAGDGWAAVNDEIITIPASTSVLRRFEGAKYKNKGVITLIPKTASALKVTAYNLK